MKKLGFFLILIFSLLAPVAGRGAEAEIMEVEELEAGMRGYGKTVFSGQRVDTFAVEVLGIMEKVMPNQDLILIRGEGDTLAHTNIISGMSGSPIYIDGKLVGALAYSWAFEKEPIAGVTPIKNIREGNELFSSGSDNKDFKKITTPLVTSGFSDDSLGFIREKFDRLGLPVQFISGGNPGKQELNQEAIDELEAGAAVGIQMVRGDLNMAAVGTATEVDRENNQIYALGHPFLNAGRVELPLTTARVQTYIPSLQSSFKIASPDQTIGTVVEDRQATISGRLGEMADLIPVEIGLENPERDIKENYSVEIIRNEFLTPGLLNSVAGNFVQAKIQQLGVNKVTTEIELDIESQLDLHIQRVAAASSLDYRPFTEIQQLWRNQFTEPHVNDASINIKLEKGNKSARISDLWLDRSHVTPGEEVTIFAELNPHRHKREIVSFDFKMPEDIPGEKVIFSAIPASNLARRLPTPQNFPQLVHNLNQTQSNSRLAIAVEYPGLNMNFGGKQYENISPAMARMFSPSNNRAVQPLPSLRKQTRDTGWNLNGNQSLRIPVKSH